MAELEVAAGNIKNAMREAEAQRSDLWMVPRENIRVLEGFNVRTEGPEYEAHVCDIGESIRANGYNKAKPLSGYVAREGEKDVIYLTDGHTRLRGVDYANERGAEISMLPVITSPAGTSMEDLTVGLVTSNNGKQLTPLEKAQVCKRLIGYGMEEGDIAKRLGLAKPYVADLLLLIGAPKKIRTMVAGNEVSAANAVDAIKKHGAGASDHLHKHLEGAKASGKTKITSKTLRPKRDLFADGIAWLASHQDEEGAAIAMLAHLSGKTVADVLSALPEAMPA